MRAHKRKDATIRRVDYQLCFLYFEPEIQSLNAHIFGNINILMVCCLLSEVIKFSVANGNPSDLELNYPRVQYFQHNMMKGLWSMVYYHYLLYPRPTTTNNIQRQVNNVIYSSPSSQITFAQAGKKMFLVNNAISAFSVFAWPIWLAKCKREMMTREERRWDSTVSQVEFQRVEETRQNNGRISLT